MTGRAMWGNYSVLGWQYWPDSREGQNITQILPDPKGTYIIIVNNLEKGSKTGNNNYD